MRLGVLGGTFDPPHVGHLLVAVDACERLELDRLLFIPAATQPLKAGRDAAPAADRLALVRLLAAEDARFGVDTAELDRGGLSFTVDTLRDLRRREPEARLVLCVGADAFARFAEWREPDVIAQLATVAVLTRGGAGPSAAALATVPGAVAVAVRRVDVSSTEIRARAAAGRSLRGFVTEPVAAYCAAHDLYRPRM